MFNNSANVAVIMPAYNAERTIAEAIESVINQEFKEWVLFIIDDCSTDDTLKIASSFQERDDRIVLIRKSINSGAVDSRNIALHAAKDFKYISFLDSDDIWFPNKLLTQYRVMEQEGGLASCCGYNVVRKGKIVSTRLPETIITLKMMKKFNRIGCLTFMYRNVDGFVFQMRGTAHGEDYDMWISIMERYKCNVVGITEVLAAYRLNPESQSSNKIRMATSMWRKYRQNHGLSVLKSLSYLCQYGAHNVFERLWYFNVLARRILRND